MSSFLATRFVVEWYMKSIGENSYKLFAKMSKRRYSSGISLNVRERSFFVDPIKFAEKQNVRSWTSKISNLVRENQSIEAINLFKTMLRNEHKPNYVTVLSVIRAAENLESTARCVHGFAIKLGFELELPIVTALVGVYSTWNMDAALKLFNRTRYKDVILWSAMVSACVKSGEYVDAIELFRKMLSSSVEPNYISIVGIVPACANLGALKVGKEIHAYSMKISFISHVNIQNSLVDMYAKCGSLKASVAVFRGIEKKDLVSWRTMIHGCVENDRFNEALSLFSQMRYCCFEPDDSVIREVIGALSELDEIKIGQCFHSLVLKQGYLRCVSVVTALLHMYGDLCEIESARSLFDRLKPRDLIAWSTMIAAYAQSELPSNAFDIYWQMQSANEKPNEIIYVSLLQACSSMAAEEIGEGIHAQVIKIVNISNPFLISSLIDMYCKFGRISQGTAIFSEFPNKDLICWSSMINGYGINGHGNKALECFLDMLNSGIKPNDVVFISVLSACSHCDLEYEGWNWFYAMEERFDVTPKLAHYACMVDMLSRQGNIEEALEFVNNMPIEPDKRIWGTLLAGCRKTRVSTEISEIVAKRLIALDPENTSYFVILSNLYAEQGRWKEVEELRQLMDEKNLKKELGYSLIETSL
ncbi:pentatricopeptide repeat-containing protein At1g11290, chloroplastic-like isoform X1 [Nicotiana tabacum]|uniref:Pentatricopeptide repeat-containing protein At1g11290, chloroplastic-like n=1 Tax=Nicotiana tabacum TaxID=4097 RepID=A0A1S4BRG3_TOBAC|nr:PREDICTED: pentatricopeptide repeat-containing protein At1g11290, chloroplastic-like [Nicotiana tabacum]XP_016491478.1 PREDICTED: pentatricopeptide repeat-containing protein At1g11290, chloroplastic-like [Nicotiana tabacum]XP_016491479.1 PREDICTED: pentatricopeptide repeat-containing protein At1g11290, chloroplastic-like [Nicotiana tabacum]